MKNIWRSTLLCCLSVGVLAAPGDAHARDTAPTKINLPEIGVRDLPKEGRDTLVLIRKGGPFPFAKDGSIFANRERILPKEPRGFYREFTVKTPYSRDRGARRIVCGGAVVKQQAQLLQSCYYTDDHYASFKKIKE